MIRHKLTTLLIALFVLSWSLAGWSQVPRDLFQDLKDKDFYEIQDAVNDYYKDRDKGRGSGYKQFKRWEWLMAPRAYPSGKLANPYARAFEAHRSLMTELGGSGSTMKAPLWTPMGPTEYTLGPEGNNGGLGRINVLAVDPQNSNRIFAGAPTSGLWKKVGSTWECITDDLDALGVSGIAIDPTDNQVIYILTGDGELTVPALGSAGVFKTTDGGGSWQATSLTFNPTDDVMGRKLIMHPTDPSILYAATSDGVYRLTNGGQNQSLVLSANIYDIEFKPQTPATIYASSENFVYTSNTSGNPGTWSSVNLNCNDCFRTAIAVTDADPSRIYALAVRFGMKGFYRSNNSGASFTLLSDSKTPNLMSAASDGSGSSGQGYYDLALISRPSAADEVHVGGINHWKSSDGGLTWEIVSYWEESVSGFEYTHADIHDFLWSGSDLYCASDGGVFKKRFGFLPWDDISEGLNIMQVYRVADLESDSDFLYLGSQDNGTNKYDGGPGVEHQLLGDGTDVAIHPKDPNTAYGGQISFGTGGPRSKVLKTVNGGMSWNEITPPTSEVRDLVPPLEMNPDDPETLYVGFKRVYRSVNGGSTWTSAASSIQSNPYKAIKVSENNSQWIYAVHEGGVVVSSNGGATWQARNNGLPLAQAMPVAVAITRNSHLRAYIGFSGYAAGEKVYMTVDGGLTWTNVSSGVPNVPISDLEIAQENGWEVVFAATDMGVGMYNAAFPFSPWSFNLNLYGLPLAIFTDLEYHQTDKLLRAATYGRGVWEAPFEAPGPLLRAADEGEQQSSGLYAGPMEGVVIPLGAETPTEAKLLLFPNPASERALVDLWIPEEAKGKLSLQSMDGSQIREVDLALGQGRYRTAFELGGLAKGVYFVTLQSGDLHVSKKLIVQ